jgi:hypothetical protein
MKDDIQKVLDSIREEFADLIEDGGRNYVEVNIGQRADSLGFSDLAERSRDAYAVVPLKAPQPGMKVRIDGRTFVNYAKDRAGIAVPGYLVSIADQGWKTYVPLDSMICNFT